MTAEAKIRGAVAALLSGDRVAVSTASRSFEGRVWELGRSPFDGYLRARVVEDDGRVHYFKVDKADATLSGGPPAPVTDAMVDRVLWVLRQTYDENTPYSARVRSALEALGLVTEEAFTRVRVERDQQFDRAEFSEQRVAELEELIGDPPLKSRPGKTLRDEMQELTDLFNNSEDRVAALEEALDSALGYISADTDRVVGQAWRLCEQIHAALGDRP